ncbi:glycosyltransferase family 4 protein [Natronoflexus pectinivorans]|uniref:UDP-N-acetylmuramyl pentapeptide phosphotransferase/UDP-N-acetylglucosamine-1-phosphate transferase n=1 Tax=Natronoflexus pectinivorans TaxID=682526 RepID=A0A4R2GKG9_9BACT|nr:MraY family glycosyltransferase [Natronoflexus pectinivorans]TCO09351.1 UDP-N-acetylmuramyl pentapeptide phosphotransferase/UDP-N-acetylglucosamine-1-phosphate transferase [Natronoflexus pectinivorans]
MNNYTIILQILSAGLLSFILVFISIPTILKVSYSKNLFDVPNRRRVHKENVPTLGGLAIFFGIIFTYLFYLDWFDHRTIPFLIPALLIVFSIGIKDDIMVTAPIMKLLGQLLAAFIIVGFGDLRITDFHGFFGLQPDYFVSMSFTIVFVVFIINGFNLIDGVDGLAAVTGIISTAAFSFWFFINGDHAMPVLGAILIGSLLAFLYFNVFSRTQKIFMGDTGSLLIGFIVSVFAIRFMEYNAESVRPALTYTMTSAPAVALGILIVPIVDTIRVFFFRISKGQSPFVADKRHIHHRMLTLGFSHIQIAILLGSVNLIFIFLSYILRDFGMLKLLILNLVLGFLIFQVPSFAIGRRRKKMLRSKNRHKIV